MGGLASLVKSLYQRGIGSDSVRHTVYPVGAGVAAVSDGAAAAWAWSDYVEIVAAATIPNPCWLTGVFCHLPVIEAFYGDFAIASGAAGSEEDLFIFPFGEELFAVVEGQTYFVPVNPAIRIAGTPRLAVRLRKNTAASAAGCTMKVQCAAAIGT